jgi:6-phosphogluconolactonase (cycloisomerase 2 family)
MNSGTRRSVRTVIASLMLLALAACGGGEGAASSTVGGTVSGLIGGSGFALLINGGDSLSIKSNGPFKFSSSVAAGMTYVVTVGSQPTKPVQNCLVSNGAGTATNGTNITQVTVICSNTYTLSVTVSGLTGSGLVLITSGGQHLNVTGNGTVAFPNPVGLATTTVAVATQPSNPSGTCQVESQGQPNANSVIPITVTCSPNIYTVGVSVTGLAGSGLILANVPQSLVTLPPPGSSLPVSANGSFTFSTLLATGAGYQVTVSVQPTNPTQTCVVQDSQGWIANANVSLTVICSVPRFAYGAGGHGNDVLAYVVNATTGALTAIAGSPYPAGDSTNAVAVDPAYRFLYAANQGATAGAGSNTISAYTINATNGELSVIAGSPFATVTAPVAIAVEPTGHYAYVANLHNNTVSAFAIDATTGALAPVTGGPVEGGIDGPRNLTVHPSGKFLYVSVGNESTIWVYSIDSNTGALSPISASPFATATGPGLLSITPNGRYAFAAVDAVTANVGGGVASFTIDPDSGALSFVGNSFLATGATALALDPGGNFGYVLYQAPNATGVVAPATVNVTYLGQAFLAQNSASGGSNVSYPFPDKVSTVTADPSGRFIYVVDANGTAWAYTASPTTGNLSATSSTPGAFSAQQPLVITRQ